MNPFSISISYSLILILLSNLCFAQNFEWAKKMGGTGEDVGRSIALSPNGNIYTTGFYMGTADFDPSVGVFTMSAQNFTADIYISKLDANGNFVWAKSIGGGTYDDISHCIAVDSSENVYISGFFADTVDFDPGPGVYNLVGVGERSVFICKLDSNGNFVWAKSFDTNTYSLNFFSHPYMAIDGAANVYFSGAFVGTVDMDPDTSVYNLTNNGLFVCKLNTFGQFKWAKNIPLGECYGITTDTQGDVYVTGDFGGVGTVDVDPGNGVFNLTSSTYSEFYILKLDSSGHFVWAKSVDGEQGTHPSGIAVDASKNVYLVGDFNDTIDFDPDAGVFYLSSHGCDDVFVLKLGSLGSFEWAKNMGGAGCEYSTDITVDKIGNIYTTGSFWGTADFDPNSGVYNLNSNGLFDLFISELDPSGNFVGAIGMGGTGSSDSGVGITTDSDNNIYTTGSFRVTVDFDPGSGVYNLTAAGQRDIFIHKMSQLPTATSTIANGLDIRVYPNPSNGMVQLEIEQDFQQATIGILNILGQVLYQTKTSDSQSKLMLPKEAGLYFIRVEVANKVVVYQVVRK